MKKVVQKVVEGNREGVTVPFDVFPHGPARLFPPNTGEWGTFGWSGVLRGAGLVFFAYIGFDAVSTAAQEAKNPQKDMAFGILGSLRPLRADHGDRLLLRPHAHAAGGHVDPARGVARDRLRDLLRVQPQALAAQGRSTTACLT